MSNPGVDSMAGHVALRSSTTSLPEAGRHVLAVVCALSCALIVGCDKNPNAPSTGNPADTATFLELIFVAVDVLVFPGEEQFFPVYKSRGPVRIPAVMKTTGIRARRFLPLASSQQTASLLCGT